MLDFNSTIMKKLLITALSCLILFSSCTKLLEEDVRTQISVQYLNTPNGVEDGVKACYSYLRTWYGTQTAAWLTVYGDEYTNGGADASFNGYTANFNSSNGNLNAPWDNLYKGINNCNAVIEIIPNVTGISEQLKSVRTAEARFLRAHYYFLLVQTWGPIPISLKPTISASNVVSRAPIADVYDVIIDDLTFSVANLPVTTTEYGRATMAAAKHSLAKVYLTRAGSSAAQSSDYSQAAQLAKDVIATASSSKLRLLDDFAAIFAQGAGTKNDEVILACQFSTDPQAGGENQSHLFFTMEYDKQPGMQRDVVYGRPYRHFRPTDYMLHLYDKRYDGRFNKSFRTVWLCNKPGNYAISGKTVAMKSGDTAIVITDYEPTQAQRNAAKYTILSPSQYNNNNFPQSSKFEDALRLNTNDTKGVKDLIIYRLGETYLIAAEALIMEGKPGEALPYINELRKRAAVEGATPALTAANRLAMEVTVADLDIDFILDERARELNGEYMRWFDLVRTGKLLERLKLYNALAAPNIQEYHVLRPIPQNQIDRTDGGAAAFPQNPGY